MTEEEKAIEWLKIQNKEGEHFLNTISDEDLLFTPEQVIEEEKQNIKNRNIILNLIEKQEKDYRKLQSFYRKDYILRSKIEEKINELEEDKKSKYYEMFLHDRDIENTINILKELLESEE